MKYIEKITFLTKEESAVLLKNTDEFIENFSDADIILRNMPKRENDINSLLEYFSQQALEWTPLEIKRLEQIIKKIDEKLEKLGFLFKFKNINFVKTTGKEEGGQVFYTRESAIVIAENRLSLPDNTLFSCLSHELFHVFSKQNKSLRKTLYNSVGFIRCKDIKLPQEIQNNTITNPDGIDRNYYYILDDEERTKFSPYIIMDKNKTEGTMFDKLRLKMMKIKEISNDEYMIMIENNEPLYLDNLQIKQYKEMIGGTLVFNEHHPDEIIADLFCYIITKAEQHPNISHPVLKNVKKLLFQE